MAYLTLFLTAFAAATLLPAYSEVLLGTLITQGYSWWWLWFWATLGNTLGSVVNGVIGRQVDRFKHKPWFPISEMQLHKARTEIPDEEAEKITTVQAAIDYVNSAQ